MKKRTVLEGSMKSSRERMRSEVTINISILTSIKNILKRVKQKRKVEI